MSMPVTTTTELGAAIRTERRRLGFAQEQLAAAAGVGPRFVRELEHGKPTAELGKALQVLHAVGLTIELVGGAGT